MATPPQRTRTNGRGRFLSSLAGRLILLMAIIVGTGVAAGYAIAYPVSHLMPSGKVPVEIDQESLVGAFDAEQALVQAVDLPKTWQQGDPKVSEFASLINVTYCGQKVEPTGRLGTPLTRNFVDTANSAVIFSEVLPMANTISARTYIGRMRAALGSCSHGRFAVLVGNTRTEYEVRDDRGTPPVSEDSYISRTLQPVGGGTTRVVTYMQLGSVLVALEYQGRPHQIADQMDKIERSMLERLVPSQFARRTDVPGLKPLPDDDSSTTVLDQTKPSPTSTPTPPPTVATTTEAPTTAAKARPRTKTTTKAPPKPATTGAPTATAPGQ